MARGTVHTAGNVARTKKLLARALATQVAGAGFSFVEILTMCPTGWFVETEEAPAYLEGSPPATVHEPGVLKDVLGRRAVGWRGPRRRSSVRPCCAGIAAVLPGERVVLAGTPDVAGPTCWPHWPATPRDGCARW